MIQTSRVDMAECLNVNLKVSKMTWFVLEFGGCLGRVLTGIRLWKLPSRTASRRSSGKLRIPRQGWCILLVWNQSVLIFTMGIQCIPELSRMVDVSLRDDILVLMMISCSAVLKRVMTRRRYNLQITTLWIWAAGGCGSEEEGRVGEKLLWLTYTGEGWE